MGESFNQPGSSHSKGCEILQFLSFQLVLIMSCRMDLSPSFHSLTSKRIQTTHTLIYPHFTNYIQSNNFPYMVMSGPCFCQPAICTKKCSHPVSLYMQWQLYCGSDKIIMGMTCQFHQVSRMCESWKVYWFLVAQWLECFHSTPVALGSSLG